MAHLALEPPHLALRELPRARLGAQLRLQPHVLPLLEVPVRAIALRLLLRERAFAAALTTFVPAAANAALARDAPPPPGILENRDRGLNEKALIANDFYFVTGRKPPRVLDVQNLPRDDPKWSRAVWKATSELSYRVDGVGRPKFDFHTGTPGASAPPVPMARTRARTSP